MTNSNPTAGANSDSEWRAHLITTAEGIGRVLDTTHRIAVIGIKADPEQPAHYVPQYAQHAGFDIVPVPVYHPEATEMLGQPVYRTLAAIPGDIDMVNVFRRPKDVLAHVDDIIAKKPKSVWMQLGIHNDEAAERLARAGIDVIQDHCLMVELRKRGR
jgi:predicted CoA-binding protein